MSEATPDAAMPALVDAAPLLSVEGLTVRFAGVTALSEVSFQVQRGELFAVIGPNGAGKTSLLNVLSRVYQPAAGRVFFDERLLAYPRAPMTALSGLVRTFLGQSPLSMGLVPTTRYYLRHLLGSPKAHHVARAGLARTFQNLGQFPLHTVLDYMLLGRHTRMKSGILLGGLYVGPTRSEEKKNRTYCLKLLDLLGLARYQGYPLGSLPFGLQKRADLARALAMEPRLLLLDEPVAGMAVEETEDIAAAILDIKEQLGITQILVEHDMAMVMGIADRVLVLDFGRMIAQGLPSEVQTNPDVIKAYLGEEFGKQSSASVSGTAETSRE